jgi:DNA replication protein DnaC
MNAINETSTMSAVMRRLRERTDWEAANPELAAEWSAAMREDDERNIRKERENDGSEARRLALDALRRADVPPKPLRELGPFDPKRGHGAKAVEYLSGKRPVLAMFGTVGQGKTLAGVWAARELLARMPLDCLATGQNTSPVVFIAATTFARLSAYSVDDKAFFDGLCRVRVLVLDDVGTETLAGVASAHFDELIDTRINFERRTIITSNLDAKAFKARYGERIADRLRQSAVISQGTGASMRRPPQ